MDAGHHGEGALSGGGGLLGGMGSGLGMPSGLRTSQLSPYFNVDTAYLQSQTPEFIFNQEQKRGRLENSFTAIGSSVLAGSIVGGVYGVFDGVRQTAAAGMTGKLRRTQIMNYTLKSGARLSNSLGTIAVAYSSVHALLSLAREQDDELKSIVAGATTGALYKSTSGARKCVAGAAFGLALSAVWAFVVKKDERVNSYI